MLALKVRPHSEHLRELQLLGPGSLHAPRALLRRQAGCRLPALLAGGGYRHGAYHAIDRDNETSATPLLGDLFLTIMQSMGVEQERFVKASRNMNDYLL